MTQRKRINNTLDRAILLSVFTGALLFGCSRGDHLKDLKTYVKEGQLQPPIKLNPIPKIVPYVPFEYSAKDVRDPFIVPAQSNLTASNAKKSGIQPDPARKKEVLEQFPLDALKYVGAFWQGHKNWALIQSSDNTTYKVAIGNYIGQHDGKVTEIRKGFIKILELMPSQGGWREYPVILDLNK